MNENTALPEAPATAGAPALSGEVQAGIQIVNARIAEVGRIRGLISQAQQDRNRAEQEHAEVFRRLAEDEAAVVLDGAVANLAFRKAALKSQETMTMHDAKIAGMRAREGVAIAALDRAAADLDAAIDRWIKAETGQARQCFDAALQPFIGAITAPLAVGIALADSRMIMISQRSLMPTATSVEASNAIEPLRFYRQNPEMLAIVNQYLGMHQAAANAVRAAVEIVKG